MYVLQKISKYLSVYKVNIIEVETYKHNPHSEEVEISFDVEILQGGKLVADKFGFANEKLARAWANGWLKEQSGKRDGAVNMKRHATADDHTNKNRK
jgi:hypothetical protein